MGDLAGLPRVALSLRGAEPSTWLPPLVWAVETPEWAELPIAVAETTADTASRDLADCSCRLPRRAHALLALVGPTAPVMRAALTLEPLSSNSLLARFRGACYRAAGNPPQGPTATFRRPSPRERGDAASATLPW